MSDFELPASNNPVRPGRRSPAPTVKQETPPELDASKLEGSGKEEEKKQDDKEPKYTKEELLRVFDEIIFSGEYVEDFMIRNKLSVSLRTRTVEEINTVQKTIDSAGLNLISTVEAMRSLMNLQYALVSYDGKDMSSMKYPEKAKFVEALPGPIVGILINLLSRLDHKVAKACEEGEANF